MSITPAEAQTILDRLPPPSRLLPNDYQDLTGATAVYPGHDDSNPHNPAAISYCIMGLMGELGEIAEKLKRVVRGDAGCSFDNIEFTNALRKEFGDVEWYKARLAYHCGVTSAEAMHGNLVKLLNRVINNTVKGSGDNR